MTGPLNAARAFLNSAMQGAISAFTGDKSPDRDVPLAFAGMENEREDGTIEFGYYVGIKDKEGARAFWLPGETRKPEVVEKLKNMEVGQEFRILREDSVGGLGIYASEIKVKKITYQIPENKPHTFPL